MNKKNNNRRRVTMLTQIYGVSNSAKDTFPKLGEYDFSSLQLIKDVEDAHVIMTASRNTIFYMALLGSIRDHYTGTNNEFDRLESVKFYKKQYLKTNEVVLVASALAILSVIDYLPDGDNPQAVVEQIVAAAEAYNPSAKAPKAPSQKNVYNYVNGRISRILGLLNSCPSSVAGLKSFGVNSANYFKQSTAETIAKTAKNKLGYETTLSLALGSFRSSLGFQDEFGGPAFPDIISFSEYPLLKGLPANLTEKGITLLEQELLVDEELAEEPISIKIKRVESKFEDSGPTASKPVNRDFSDEDLMTHLTPIEVHMYRIASRNGNKQKALQLAEKVKAAINQEQVQPVGTTGTVEASSTAPDNPKGIVQPEAQGSPSPGAQESAAKASPVKPGKPAAAKSRKTSPPWEK